MDNQNINGIHLPLLGQKTKSQIIDDIYKSITNQAAAAEFYTKLLGEAQDGLHRRFIEHARDDELEHLHFFKMLYVYYTGREPQYKVRQTEYADFKQGVQIALNDELEAVEFYRDVQLSVKNQLTRDTFYYAMVDELEHATMFSTILNQL